MKWQETARHSQTFSQRIFLYGIYERKKLNEKDRGCSGMFTSVKKKKKKHPARSAI